MQPRQSKEKTLYRGIAQAAFEIAFKRREYWILGFLAALLMMNGGAFEFIVRAFHKISSGSPYDGAIALGQTAAFAIARGDFLSRASLFIMILLCLAVFAAIFVLATASGGGLIKAASRISSGKKLTPRAAFAGGMEKIGPLILTQLIGRTIIFVSFVLAALGAFTVVGNLWSDLVAIALFVVFAIAALAISFLMMMTDAGIMINGDRWIHSAHAAIIFLRKHWLISLEMIGLVFLTAVVAALTAVVAALVLLVPFTLALAAMAALRSIAGIMIIVFSYEVIILAIVAVIGAVLAVFERSVWALLYTRLEAYGGTAKIERLWRRLMMRLHARFSR
jgi:hypothetical protein